MMPYLLPLSLLLIFTLPSYSSAAYCVCNAALSDAVLQKNIDYACGAGADCGQISQNGPCFNPNTVKDHCNFAVNSYYQKKGQVPGSCDFSGTANVSQTPPAGNSACFSGSSSPATPTPGTGTGTPTPGTGTATPPPGTGTGTPTPGTGTATPPPGTGMGTPPPGTGTGTGTPGTGTGTGTGTPGTGTGTGTGIGTGTGTGTGNGGINVNPPLGLGPSGAGSGFDNSGSISIRQITNLYTLAATLLGCGLIWSRLI